MKVKTKQKLYNDWRTENQWNELNKTVIDKTDFVTMWANQWCGVSAAYFSPDNVRDMTLEEITAYKETKRVKAKEQRHEAKERQLKELDTSDFRFVCFMLSGVGISITLLAGAFIYNVLRT